MKTLALEFSSDQRSVAVVADGQVLGQAYESGGRASRPFSLIEAVLREARLEREAIECLAVGLGPGSYAGVRAAIALAQGWELARGVKLRAISSAECLAAQAQAAGRRGRLLVVIDAQRGEFYRAAYHLMESGWRVETPLSIVSLETVRAEHEAATPLVGPDVARGFPAGQVMFPAAATLGQLAATAGDFVPGEKLEPIYLRETAFLKAPPPRVLA